MNAYPWIPPWLGPLCSLIVAALVTIHLLGGYWWLYAVLAVGVLGGFVWAVWGYRLAEAAVAAYHRIRARRYADEPEQVVEQVPAG